MVIILLTVEKCEIDWCKSDCFFYTVEDIFADVADTKLHLMINEVYLATSKKVLDIVMGPHKLLDHLQAMRKYLLLGQGDFVGLLMEKIKYVWYDK